MKFRELPESAAWRHQTARNGFEVVFLRANATEVRCDGCTTAIEASRAFIVEYAIELDAHWHTRRARVRARASANAPARETTLVSDGRGHWHVDGRPAPQLDGCLDVDLESSSLTNAFPIQRLALAVGGVAEAPAAYVRALDLAVERLEQRYVRIEDDHGRPCFEYSAPRFDFEAQLIYDESGLVLEYPGISVRMA
jgi:hypothetical protein